MRILLDFERLRNLNSGLGQFCLNLGNSLISKAKDHNINFTVYRPSSLSSIFGDKVNYQNARSFYKFFKLQCTAEILHCTHQDSYLLPLSRSQKVVLTIHDLNFLSKGYSKKKVNNKLQCLQRKVDRADAITFISKYSMDEASRYLDLKDKKIKIIYNGLTPQIKPSEAKPHFVNDSQFIFTIGIISAKKNFKVLIPLLVRNTTLTLIIAGINDGPYALEILQFAKELSVGDRVIMPGAISEGDKSWLYINCKAFVFPSLAEGFGLPVIEAMSLGKPVFLSKATSLPEIGGEEAYYFDSFEPDSMNEIFQKGLISYHQDVDKRQKLIDYAHKFSWNTAADQYLELYKSI